MSCLTLVGLLKESPTSNTKTKIYCHHWKVFTYFVFDCCLLILIQVNLNQLGTIQFHTDALANNLSWEDEIVENCIVDSSQSTATWSLLFVGIWAAALWLGQDPTLGTEDNVTSREFLLQFTNQTDLDLLERSLLWNGNVDNDSLKDEKNKSKVFYMVEVSMETHFLGSEFNLACASNVEFTKLLLQIGVHLQLQKSLADLFLKFIGLSASALYNLGSGHLR